LILASSAVLGCQNAAFRQITSRVLAETGYVNSSQVDSVLGAGGKLIKAQESLTPEQEYYLGRAVSAQLLGKFSPVTSAALIQYVNRVGATVAGVSEVPETFGGYHFVVVESPEINAMSAPGGFVFLSTGFLKEIPDEDGLAAVLAHEVAHVVKRHGANAISNSNLFSAIADATSAGIAIAKSNTSSSIDLAPITSLFEDSVTGVVDKLLTKGFDRSQEYDADLYAAQLLQKAGYDPKALVRVLEILQKRTNADGSGWYATHPSPSDRVDELEDDFEMPNLPVAQSTARAARFSAIVR
jgi:predicted Zn-dependent protease